MSKCQIVGNHMGHDARKSVFRGFANNTGADQPAHQRRLMRRLISAFVIHFLESIISDLLQAKFQFSS